MKNNKKAFMVFTVTLSFTLLACILDTILRPEGKDTLISAFAFMGIFGSIVSFIAAIVDAFKN